MLGSRWFVFSGTSIKHLLRGHVREHSSLVHSRLDVYNIYRRNMRRLDIFLPPTFAARRATSLFWKIKHIFHTVDVNFMGTLSGNGPFFN